MSVSEMPFTSTLCSVLRLWADFLVASCRFSADALADWVALDEYPALAPSVTGPMLNEPLPSTCHPLVIADERVTLRVSLSTVVASLDCSDSTESTTDCWSTFR